MRNYDRKKSGKQGFLSFCYPLHVFPAISCCTVDKYGYLPIYSRYQIASPGLK